ncbi:MAG TPA: hypothetical protein VE359_20365 [Vicinamibacteria bacterium]|nr:hypothetical protein [Vicinamibacteria bacterium]
MHSIRCTSIGTFVSGALVLACSVGAASDIPPGRAIGEFSREGEYIKDFFVQRDGDTYHLFYNVGAAGPEQDWQAPGNEKAFGHASTRDLKTWTHHPRILPVVPGSWEGQVVSAPSIVRTGDGFLMAYTGFDDRVLGRQSIGLATSRDLFTWERVKANPRVSAPAWTMIRPSGWLDCRDGHLIRHGDELLLYYMTTTSENRGAIGLASSPDGAAWKDLGPALVTFDQPESPSVFEHNGVYYLFATSGLGRILSKSRDPKSGRWQEVPFAWPEGGLWSGWEVFQFGERTVFAAFIWKPQGNFIRFWEIEWDGETPVCRY